MYNIQKVTEEDEKVDCGVEVLNLSDEHRNRLKEEVFQSLKRVSDTPLEPNDQEIATIIRKNRIAYRKDAIEEKYGRPNCINLKRCFSFRSKHMDADKNLYITLGCPKPKNPGEPKKPKWKADKEKKDPRFFGMGIHLEPFSEATDQPEGQELGGWVVEGKEVLQEVKF